MANKFDFHLVEVPVEQVLAAVELIIAVAEVIEARKEIPNGELWAFIMPSGVPFAMYQAIIQQLKMTGLVVEKYNCLYWVGQQVSNAQYN